MSNIFKTEWTITPTTAPQPWLACSTCGTQRPFICSDRFRLNANGKKLDAWLIYRCTDCDKTWNHTLFERRSLRSFDAEHLSALQSNDIGWIRRFAFDVDALRRHTQRIDQFADAEISKIVVSATSDWTLLEIGLRVPAPVSIRVDRLLAVELGLSRSRLQALDQARKIRLEPERKSALKRMPCDGMRVTLDLSAEPDRALIAGRLCDERSP